MTRYILSRNVNGDTLYLSERYDWGISPMAFPEWQFKDVLFEAMQYKDRPQRVGELVGGDLDKAKWTEL